MENQIFKGAKVCFIQFRDNAKDLPSCKYLLAPKRFRSYIHLSPQKNLLYKSINLQNGWLVFAAAAAGAAAAAADDDDDDDDDVAAVDFDDCCCLCLFPSFFMLPTWRG